MRHKSVIKIIAFLQQIVYNIYFISAFCHGDTKPLRLHVQLKHEMAGTKKFFWSYYMIYLISYVFQAFWHIYTGFGPHLTLSLAGWNINVWVKCKNGEMENFDFKFFGWLDFFSNFYQIITITFRNYERKKSWGWLLKLGILKILLFFGAKSIYLGS